MILLKAIGALLVLLVGMIWVEMYRRLKSEFSDFETVR